MSEDKFFQMVQGKLENFSPEVPQAAYVGMRRKYAVSKFMRWNAGRLNVWYALLLVGVASATVFTLSTGETQVAKQGVNMPVELTKMSAPTTAAVVNGNSSSCLTDSNTSCKSKKVYSKRDTQVANVFPNCIIPESELTLMDEQEEIKNESTIVTPIIEEIVKVKELPAKPKTSLTIPVYEKKDK